MSEFSQRLQAVGRLVRTVRYLQPRQIVFRVLRRNPLRRVARNVGFAPWNRLRRRLLASPVPASEAVERSHVPRDIFATAPDPRGRISATGIELDGVISPISPQAWNETSRFRLYRLHSHSFLGNPRNDLAAEIDFLASAVVFLSGTSPGDGNSLATAWEPHPAALRIVNWVRWAARTSDHRLLPASFGYALQYHAQWLRTHIEWETDGNHLIDNAAALVLAGWYVRRRDNASGERLLSRGITVMLMVLPQQVLPDGFHNERSPMYHYLVTERVLDVCAVLQDIHGAGAADAGTEERELIRAYAARMVEWIQNHPDPPPINDAFWGLAPSRQEVLRYAASLGVSAHGAAAITIAEGVHDITRGPFRVVFDADAIGPDHVPGHAHADTLQVLLWFAGSAVLSDTGTSTYDPGARRNYERSTAAHNTVVVGNESSSEVWGTFRVGRRARVTAAKVVENTADQWHARARHDGYGQRHVYHERTVMVHQDRVVIRDHLDQPRKHARPMESCAYFHFAPGVSVTTASKWQMVTDTVTITFQSPRDLEIQQFMTEEAVGFEKRRERVTIAVHFDSDLETIIEPRDA